MNLTLQLPPNKNALIQLMARVGGAAIGSPIAGVPDSVDPTVYRFPLGQSSTGDYDVQLSGVSNPPGAPFSMRNGVAYPSLSWSVIDATIFTPPIITQPNLPDVCRVQLIALRGAIAIPARVQIDCGSTGRLDAFAFSESAFDGYTDAGGLLVVDLPWSSLPGVGKYRFKLIDLVTGKTLHDRTCTVPDQPNANYEDLV